MATSQIYGSTFKKCLNITSKASLLNNSSSTIKTFFFYFSTIGIWSPNSFPLSILGIMLSKVNSSVKVSDSSTDSKLTILWF